MKKIVSVQKGNVIRFRASGNKGGGGPDDKSPGGSGTVYVITNDGILATDDHALMIEERLGSQVRISDPKEKDVAKQQAEEEAKAGAPVLEEGMACKTDDGQDGVLKSDGEGGLVCTVPEN